MCMSVGYMLDQDEIDSQQERLATHRRTLAYYLNQEAKLGEAYTPPGVFHGIDEARDEIRRIKQILRAQGVTVEDYPDDDGQTLHIHAPAASDVTSPRRPLRVFLCHSSGDKPEVYKLYQRLRADGFDPWLDREDLLPGQDWRKEIPKAVRGADVVLVCLSRGAIAKNGYVRQEIEFALDAAESQPTGAIYLIPVKLKECAVPDRLARWQWVNLFEPDGYERLLRALNKRADALGLSVQKVRQEPDDLIPVERAQRREPSLSIRSVERPGMSRVGQRELSVQPATPIFADQTSRVRFFGKLQQLRRRQIMIAVVAIVTVVLIITIARLYLPTVFLDGTDGVAHNATPRPTTSAQSNDQIASLTSEAITTPILAPTVEFTQVLPRESSTQSTISTPTLASPAITATPPSDAVVSSESINMRSGPGTIYPSVGVYAQGIALKIVGKEVTNGWLQVKAPNGQVGWMSIALLRVNLDLSTVALVAAPPTPTLKPPVYTPTPKPVVNTPVPALINADGHWYIYNGRKGHEGYIAFDVNSGSISNIFPLYAQKNGGVNCFSRFDGANAQRNGNTFSFTGNKDGRTYRITIQFISENSASGTLKVEPDTPDDTCNYSFEATFKNAKRM